MGQTYNSTNPESGVTIFGDLYGIIRNHVDAAVTLFAGASSPSSPEAGRPWFDTGNEKVQVYTGSAWQDIDVNSALYDEVVAARGSAANLDARLDAALNDDGTISGSSPAGSWWTAGSTPWVYYSTVQFKENGDKTAVYTIGRAMKFAGVSGAPQYSYVTQAAYSGGTTTVTLKDAILDASMTTPQFGQTENNTHYRLPWTRILYSNSATSKDYASANQAPIADGSGGVTLTTIVGSGNLLADQKKFGSL